MIRKAIQSNGVVEAKDIFYIRTDLRELVNKSLVHLLKEGELVEINIDGMGDTSFFTNEAQLKLSKKETAEKSIHILSPFDNAIIQRKRVQNLFDFDYKIECYVPEAKREFGYFCLPVLYGDKFVARFDPKADRASKTFYVKAMHFEKDFRPDEAFNELFWEKLTAFAAFNGCQKIVIDKADKKWMKGMLGLGKSIS